MTAHQDVAVVVDVERQIREMGFDAVMAQNLAEIVRISEQAGKDESAAEIARLSKALSEAEAERDRWAAQSLKEDDCRQGWQNRAEAAESRLAEAMRVIEPIITRLEWSGHMQQWTLRPDMPAGSIECARRFHQCREGIRG